MFGMNEAMSKLLFSQAKTQIKAKGIKFVAIVYNESTDEMAARAFQESVYMITEPMLKELQETNAELYNKIISLNNSENK